jgi:hypothetical protein
MQPMARLVEAVGAARDGKDRRALARAPRCARDSVGEPHKGAVFVPHLRFLSGYR